MSSELKVAIKAAKEGAKQALIYFDKNPKVVLKPDRSPVTEADKTAEEVIKRVLMSNFPGAKFLGEEHGGKISQDKFWTIDPIDGTANFIRGLPFWGVEIALVESKKPILGVSFGPVISELIYAEKGKGAYLNNKRISVSKIDKLADAFLNHGTLRYYENKLNNLLNLTSVVGRQRGFGDFYGYHLVAQGKADIMLDAKNGPWDIAALKIIIEEAGGRVTNFIGEEWKLTDGDCVATNGLLHDDVIRILNKNN